MSRDARERVTRHEGRSFRSRESIEDDGCGQADGPLMNPARLGRSLILPESRRSGLYWEKPRIAAGRPLSTRTGRERFTFGWHQVGDGTPFHRGLVGAGSGEGLRRWPPNHEDAHRCPPPDGGHLGIDVGIFERRGAPPVRRSPGATGSVRRRSSKRNRSNPDRVSRGSQPCRRRLPQTAARCRSRAGSHPAGYRLAAAGAADGTAAERALDRALAGRVRPAPRRADGRRPGGPRLRRPRCGRGRDGERPAGRDPGPAGPSSDSGLELVHRRGEGPAAGWVPVILHGGRATDRERIAALDLGAFDVLGAFAQRCRAAGAAASAAGPRPDGWPDAAPYRDALTGLINRAALETSSADTGSRRGGTARLCPCCWSTWTDSRRSTTRTAMPPATTHSAGRRPC